MFDCFAMLALMSLLLLNMALSSKIRVISRLEKQAEELIKIIEKNKKLF